ncbi:MAG TPA: DedA family protein [Candidatus Kerfeldbacteria bacterium]|nr:DedA family protein [Candidatus Kerfeldbacteria bacterium]
MNKMSTLFDLFLHLDEQLSLIIAQYGIWTYAIVALIVFCETGLVVTPFLPGDSLLFALGTLAARGDLNIWYVMGILFLAVLLGDNVNYWVGRRLGPALFSGKSIRWLNQEHLHETQEFYKRHGGKTVILARFVPIVRTFAPFVAGIGAMSYGTFLSYSLAGSALWIIVACGAGYFFGNIPIVQQNFEFVVIGIVLISLLPAAVKFIRHKYRRPRVDTDRAG